MKDFSLKTAYIVEKFNFFIDNRTQCDYNKMDVIHDEISVFCQLLIV